MTYTMKLPDVGEGVAEAELVEWMVEVGDEVTPDSVLVEVLTDKATVEVSCPVSGVVAALHGEPGDVLAVGNVLVEIDTGGDSAAADTTDTEAPSNDGTEEQVAEPTELTSAQTDDRDHLLAPPSIGTASVGTASDGAPSQETPSDTKPSDTKPSDMKQSGTKPSDTKRPSDTNQSDKPPSDMKKSDKKKSDMKKSDKKKSDKKKSGTKPSAEKKSDKPPSDKTQPSTRRPTAAPAVRRRAQELDVDLSSVSGTGPDGRIVHADLDGLIADGRRNGAGDARRGAAGGGQGGRAGAGRSTAGPERSDDSHPEPVRGIRRRIAERLTAAWTEIPHITYVESVDVTELERLRAELNLAGQERSAQRLTVLPFVTMAVSIACSEQPMINSHYDHAQQVLTRHDAVHVGIATQTDGGLLVPVVRHAAGRGLRDLAGEITRVTEAARDGSATRDELSGSTITITSLGAIGGVATTPILNAPEVAIVGVNKIDVQPVWRADRFEPRQVLNLSSSFDHRMVDGWDAAVFVQRIKALMETPALLFLDD